MRFDALRGYMRTLLDSGVPGLELIVCRDHEILFHECAGFSDEARKTPTSPSDRYWLYSCTKPVTAATAMCAMEEGLFTLDDPVSRYLPAYENITVLRDGKSVKAQTPVTIRHLLTMTAGLNYDLHKPAVDRLLAQKPDTADTVDIAEAFATEPLCFEPGSRFQYSLCHDVLGAVIEKCSGMTYRDYVRSRILEPLSMTRTDFCTEGVPAGLAAQYTFDFETRTVRPVSPANTFIVSPKFYSGGAGLVSTATDYLKFADALACGGKDAYGTRILTNASIDHMRTEQIHDCLINGTFTCTCGDDYGYGLGVRTRVSFHEGVPSAYGEFGWDGAAGADILIDPEHRLSMVYVQHVLNWPDMLGIVHLKLRDLLYPALGICE